MVDHGQVVDHNQMLGCADRGGAGPRADLLLGCAYLWFDFVATLVGKCWFVGGLGLVGGKRVAALHLDEGVRP